MKRQIDLCLVWCGVPFIALFFTGLLLFADFVPPPSPALSAEQVTAIFEDRAVSIRTGMVICFVGSMFMLPLGAGIINQTRRIRATSGLAIAQMISLGAGVPIILFRLMIWWLAAFRPGERPAADVQFANDLACMIFIGGIVPYVAWAMLTGVAILCDTAHHPIFPRWAGYFSLFVALIQIPALALVFTHTGPFAWDGLMSWWIPLTDFFIWIVVMMALSIRAAKAQDDIETPGVAGVADPSSEPSPSRA